jgi:hypothetical protein
VRESSSYENRVREIRNLRTERDELRSILKDVLGNPATVKKAGNEKLRQAALRLVELNERLDSLDGVGSAISKAIESNRQGEPALLGAMFHKRSVTKASDTSHREKQIQANLLEIRRHRSDGRTL